MELVAYEPSSAVPSVGEESVEDWRFPFLETSSSDNL